MFQIHQIITFIYCTGEKKYHFACSCTGSVPLFMVWNLLLAKVLPCQYLVILDPPTPLTQTHRADQIKIIIRSIQQKGYGICDQLMYLTFYQRNENVGEPWPDSSIYIYMSIIKWCGHVKYLLAYSFRFNLQSTYSQTKPSR